MENRPKDPCVMFRNVVRGQSKSKNDLNPQGHDRIQLYLNTEQSQMLIDTLTSQIANPLGTKLDLHIVKRQNAQRGNIFDSAYAFIKPVEEQQSMQSGPARFVPKATQSAETMSRTQEVHQELEQD